MSGVFRFCFTQALGMIEIMDREEAKKKRGLIRPAFKGEAAPIFDFLSEQVFHGNENYNWTAIVCSMNLDRSLKTDLTLDVWDQ